MQQNKRNYNTSYATLSSNVAVEPPIDGKNGHDGRRSFVSLAFTYRLLAQSPWLHRFSFVTKDRGVICVALEEAFLTALDNRVGEGVEKLLVGLAHRKFEFGSKA